VSGDEICLTLPADEAFHGVAHLVLGGLAVRLDLTYENLQDLELALDALLERSGTGRSTRSSARSARSGPSSKRATDTPSTSGASLLRSAIESRSKIATALSGSS